MTYLDLLAERVRALARAGLARPLPVAHRALQQQAEACAYAYVTGAADPVLLARAEECLAALVAQQGRDGLFRTGDNVESPPDSSFTANGLARLVRVGRTRRDVRGLADASLEVLVRLAPGLVQGGVHTPNHRWELAAALAQLGDLIGDDRYGARADEWLAEGIDIQDDGLYSERSPNYAAAVTNPCLLALADLRGRSDLVEIVHANLHASHTLTDATGRVETLQSRRQDQAQTDFPMARFAWLYRQLAHRLGCASCGAEAVRGEAAGGSDVLDAVAGVLLDADLAADPPVRALPGRTGWTVLQPSGLAIHRDQGARLVVREAPDVAALGRIASGSAANPTLAHLRVGPVWLSSVRISRAFFGLGPFRATSLDLEQGRVVLRETQAAAYYQPNPAGEVRYGFEGRFAAEMGFDARRQDLVSLDTMVTLAPQPGGFELTVDTRGPDVPHAVELGFADAEGALVRGEADDLGDQRWWAWGATEVHVAGAVVSIESASDSPPTSAADASYDPGEAYTFLRGTDAVGGLRLYVTTRSPGRLQVRVSVGEPAKRSG